MTWTATSISILDGAAASKVINCYTDGTNYSFANVLFDTAGAILAPATSGLQATGNASLAAIATSVSAGATAAGQATGNASLATLAAGVTIAAGGAAPGRVA